MEVEVSSDALGALGAGVPESASRTMKNSQELSGTHPKGSDLGFLRVAEVVASRLLCQCTLGLGG